MRTASGLTVIALGAILAFAVSAHPPFLNIQAAGVVLILTGIAGMVIPRSRYGWLLRKIVRRHGPGGRVTERVEETQLPPYMSVNPGAATVAEHPAAHIGQDVSIPAVNQPTAPPAGTDGKGPAPDEVTEQYFDLSS